MSLPALSSVERTLQERKKIWTRSTSTSTRGEGGVRAASPGATNPVALVSCECHSLLCHQSSERCRRGRRSGPGARARAREEKVESELRRPEQQIRSHWFPVNVTPCSVISRANAAGEEEDLDPEHEHEHERRRWMMVCVSLRLLFTLLLMESSLSSPGAEAAAEAAASSGAEEASSGAEAAAEAAASSGAEEASSGAEAAAPPCPPRWLGFGPTCFSFFPVWSSWSAAKLLCSQTGSDLATLHTPEEREFVRQLVNTHTHTHTPVWLSGDTTPQNTSWFGSEDSALSGWTNQKQGRAGGGGACLAMTPTSGELRGAPCGELGFYVCGAAAAAAAAASAGFSSDRKPEEPGLVGGVSLFEVVWSFSDPLAGEILRSSSFLQQLRGGRLTRRCHARFSQQEALYLLRVSGTLEALIGRLQEEEEVRSLLMDTLKHYSSRNQSPPPSPPPQWLLSSLQSFHAVVLEEPLYLLVALSARARLHDLILSELRADAPLESEAGDLHRVWREDALMDVAWTRSFRRLIQEHQDHVDVFKAVNIFREHMMNQRRFHKALFCEEEGDG